MSTIGNFEGFQPVSLKQEGDELLESDHPSKEEASPSQDSARRPISSQTSVTESTLYPNPYQQPYVSRKYFVTRVKS